MFEKMLVPIIEIMSLGVALESQCRFWLRFCLPSRRPTIVCLFHYYPAVLSPTPWVLHTKKVPETLHSRHSLD